MERERVTVSIGGILVFAQDSSTNFNLHKLKDIFQKKKSRFVLLWEEEINHTTCIRLIFLMIILKLTLSMQLRN